MYVSGEYLAYNRGTYMLCNRITLTLYFYKNGKNVRSGNEINKLFQYEVYNMLYIRFSPLMGWGMLDAL